MVSKIFAGSGVRRVELPATPREIGEAAFDGCQGLRCLASREKCDDPSVGDDACAIGENAFRGCGGLREVRVEAGCGARGSRPRSGRSRSGPSSSVRG